MWDLPKGKQFLPSASLGELNELFEREQQAKPKVRLLCAVQRKRGRSIDQISSICGMHRNTVHGILRRFDERGVAAKDGVRQSGRPPVLTKRQRQKLVSLLEHGPPRNPSGLWTTKEVRELIRKEFGITFVNQHVWRILKACGFTLLRPRRRHAKAANRMQQESFKKSRGDLPAATGGSVLSWPAQTRQRTV